MMNKQCVSNHPPIEVWRGHNIYQGDLSCTGLEMLFIEKDNPIHVQTNKQTQSLDCMNSPDRRKQVVKLSIHLSSPTFVSQIMRKYRKILSFVVISRPPYICSLKPFKPQKIYMFNDVEQVSLSISRPRIDLYLIWLCICQYKRR